MNHLYTYLFIHSFIKSVFIRCKLYTRHCGYNNVQERQSLSPHGAYIQVDSNASGGSNVLINPLFWETM